MYLLKDNPALLMDLYELTMAQAYFEKGLNETAYFEVSIRNMPENWGFFVMAGLAELNSYLKEFRFSEDDIKFLKSTGKFSSDFLEFLKELKPEVEIRAIPEGSVFFALEPILEVGGRMIDAQILESYILNILGFSIIEASLATRISIAAQGTAVMDFGLRRAQGPVAAVRAARGASMANFSATSNLFASRVLGFASAGTMAHSFVEAHESEEQAFMNFADVHGKDSVLLVDTYEPTEGIKKAATIARDFYKEKGIKIKGVRIDSGDLVYLTKFARGHFRENGVPFLKIFVSGGLDEFSIAKLLKEGAEIDGIGIGTNFAASHYAPDLDIIYKLVRYGEKDVFKKSPNKETYPGRKTVVRTKKKYYEKDTVLPLRPSPDDILKPLQSTGGIETIRKRLSAELSNLRDSVKRISNPQRYIVEFAF